MAFAFEEYDIITPDIAKRWEAICAKDYAKHPDYPVLDTAVQHCLNVINRFDYALVPASNREAVLNELAVPLSRLREVRDLLLDQLYTRCIENIDFRMEQMKEKPTVHFDKETFLELADMYAQSNGLANPDELAPIFDRLAALDIPAIPFENMKWEIMDYLSEAARTQNAFTDVEQVIHNQLTHQSHVPLSEFDLVMNRIKRDSLQTTEPESNVQVVEATPVIDSLRTADVIDLASRRK